jgi:NADH dehydrogenase/NADH:ubiquinone oxidoreductase subunit G
MMLKVKINDKSYEAEKGEFVLELCRRNSVIVPTYCHHDSLSGLGACRLCVVEVDEGSGKKVVVSCMYPLSRDCEVFTETEKINGIRKTILSMLRSRAPEAERLAFLCQKYGAGEEGRFTQAKSAKGGSAEKRLASACILCGLCAQACASLGTGAISTVGRGVSKKVSTPFDEPSADCVGCGSCAAVCPAKAIDCIEAKGTRSIWGRKFKLLSCDSCGKAFATEEEYALALNKAALQKAALPREPALPKAAVEKAALPTAPEPALCDACRRKKSAGVFAAAFGQRN